MSALAVPAHALPHYLAFMAALDEEDQPAPCRQDPALWTSDDPTERAWAADGCLDCPAMQLCHQYANAADEPRGVWGGRDRSPTRGRRPTTREEAA